MRQIFVVFLILMSYSATVSASAGLTYHGRLIAPSGVPVTSSVVTFRIRVKSPGSEDCLLYEEQQTKDLSQTNGVFALEIGSLSTNRTDTTGLPFDRIFSNQGVFSLSGNCQIGNDYTPAYADNRKLEVFFNDGTFSGWEAMPAQAVNYVPKALDSLKVGGFSANHLLRVESGSVPQAVSSITPTQFSEMMNLILGTSTQYMKTSATGASLPSFASDPSGVTAGQMWYDSAGNVVKFYNGSTIQTLGVSGSGISSLTAGAGLTGGTITTSGTIALATTGTAGTYYQVTTDAYGRVTAGQSSLLETDIPNISTAGKVSGSAITSGTIGGSTAISTSGSIQTTGDVTSRRNVLYDHSGVGPGFVALQSPADMSGVNYTLTFPLAAGTAGQVLGTTNTTGTLAWTNPVATDLSTIVGTGIVQRNGANSYSTVNVVAPLSYAGGNLGLNAGSGGILLDGGNTVTGTLSAGTISSHNVEIKTANTTRMTVDTSGNVGIGTATPGSLLHVEGTTSVPVLVRSNSTWQTGVQISNMSSGVHDWSLLATGSANVAGLGKFLIYDNAASLTRMAIDPSGHVGIGTTYPLGPLHVRGGADHNLAIYNATTGMTIASINDANTTGAPLILNPGINGGNVGIGTMNPSAVLEVASVGTSSPIKTSRSDNTTQKAAVSFVPAGALSASNVSWFSGMDTNTAGFAIASYDGTSTAHRLFVQPDGNVGIGTTTPSVALEVNGVVKATSFEGTMVSSGATNTGSYTINTDSNSSGGDGGFNFQIRGSTVAQISDAGGFFVNKAPISSESFAVTNALGKGSSIGSQSNDGSTALFVTPNATTQAGLTVRGLASQSAPLFQVQDSTPSDKFVVAANGNVGIGTVAPTSLLHLSQETGAATFRLNSSMAGAGNGGYFNFTRSRGTASAPTAVAGGDITMQMVSSGYDGSAHQTGLTLAGVVDGTVSGGSVPTAFTIGTGSAGGGSERLRITSGGNVGIGTTNPFWNLEVVSSGNPVIAAKTTGTAGSAHFIGFQDNGGSLPNIAQGLATFQGRSSNAANAVFPGLSVITSEAWTGSAQGAVLAFNTVPNGTITTLERMRIDHNGNVGIGTTSPSDKLVIGSQGIVFHDGGSKAIGFNTAYDGSTGWNVQSGGAFQGALQFHPGSGDIGIGIANTNGANFMTSANKMTIAATGNVGIGNISPAYKLDIEGGDANAASAANGTGGTYARLRGDGGLMLRRPQDATTGSVNGYIDFYGTSGVNRVSYNELSNSMYFTQGSNANAIFTGNVGLGTTSPGAALDVVGTGILRNSTSWPTFSLIGQETAGAYPGALLLQNSRGGAHLQAGDHSGVLSFRSTLAGETANIVSRIPANHSGTSTPGELVFRTTPVGGLMPLDRLTIDSNGNVGIGTTSPTNILSVQRDAQINASFTSYASGTYNSPGIVLYRGNGSASSPSYPIAGDRLGGFSAAQAIATPSSAYSGMEVYTTEAHSSVAQGARLQFNTIPNGAVNAQARMTIDNTGYVGIGTTTPSSNLHVHSDVNPLGGLNQPLLLTTNSDFSSVTMSSGQSGKALSMHFGANAPAIGNQLRLGILDKAGAIWEKNPVVFDLDAPGGSFTLDGTGNVGIGITTPGYKLDVQGGDINASGSVRAAGVALTSDIRYKRDIETLPEALDKILRIRGVSYNWRTQEFPQKHFNDRHQIGVIAQEVEAQFPELVDTGKDGYKSVNYAALVAPLIEGVKTLYRRVVGIEEAQLRQQREVASLKTENQLKDQKIKQLESENASIKKWICAKDPKAALCN